jgi:hypothetical protein
MAASVIDSHGRLLKNNLGRWSVYPSILIGAQGGDAQSFSASNINTIFSQEFKSGMIAKPKSEGFGIRIDDYAQSSSFVTAGKFAKGLATDSAMLGAA